MTGAIWVEARGLTKTFGGVTAIGGADLTLRAGEIRGIVGPNGAGKSTLMQMLAGLHPIDGGELKIDGEAVQFRGPDDALASGISLVPQEMQLSPNHTVAENIVLGREPRRFGVLSARRSRQIASAALTRLGTDIDVGDSVDSLTAVGRRLVMVARALAGDARLIILDEPTAALGPQEADAILKTVEILASSGVTVLYVSHRFDDIERVAHSVTGVRDAKIIADLTREEITRARLVELVTPVDQVSHPVRAESGISGGPDAARGDRLVATDVSGGPLAGVDFRIRAGEIVGFAGLAGSGVDELIRIAAGIDKRTGGSVTVDGEHIASGDRLAAVKKGVAYVPGDRTLAAFSSHDVMTNISIADLSGVASGGVANRSKERTRTSSLAERVRLAAPLSAAMSSLSGGNQQKAIFARWMACDARVLLLHDPTAGVDVGARAEIHQRIRELAATGLAVMVVTTDIPELVELSDRVITLDRGRAVAEMTGEQITELSVTASMTSAAEVSA